MQRLYLMNLDWLLMTYTTIVGLSYALAFNRESQARAVKEAQLETRLVEARLQTLAGRAASAFSLQHTPRDLDAACIRNPDAADRMISRLSDLLRLTFDRSGAAASRCRKSSSSSRSTSRSSRRGSRTGSRSDSTSRQTPSTRKCRA